MVAELARGDWEDLRAAGLEPTLEDFDRLNLLAVRLEAGAETTPANHPRIGWAGDVPFHEPTVCAIMWLNDCARRASGDAETQQTFFWFACAHATTPSAFGGLETPEAIERAVKKWLRSVPCTVREMERAVRYAAWGLDDAAPAETAMSRAHRMRANRTKAEENMERLERIVAQASAATGLSYLDMMMQTPSRLNAMVLAAQVEAGAVLKPATARMMVEYTATLNEIRQRLVEERAVENAKNGDAQ